MGNNPPWLDNLSDDWVPTTPGTPASLVPARSFTHSRQSSLASLPSLQSSPSRIPVPARRSVEKSPARSPRDLSKKVTRPCHFYKKEPPTPKTPRTPRTPSKLRSPVPDKTRTPRSTPSARQSPNTGRKQPQKTPQTQSQKQLPSQKQLQKQPQRQSPMDTRSPLRSVSNISSQSGQQSTVQIKPKKGTDKESTPEWRKRLVKGDIPAGNQRDLFAPMGLESVFKPPTPGSAGKVEKIPTMKQTNEFWDLGDHDPSRAYDDDSKHTKDGGVDQEPNPPGTTTGYDGTKDGSSPHESPKGTLDIKKGPTNHLNPNPNHEGSSQIDANQRTASGLEDLRHEGITPITFSRVNTIESNGTSEVIKSALKQVTSKLEGLSSNTSRPESSASDSVLFHTQNDPHEQTLPEDEFLDVTSHSLPQDLSMGTLDYRGRGAFANFRRGNESSFHRRHLSPGSFPSQRLSPATMANSRIRSSPPYYNKHPLVEPPTLPRPSSAYAKTSTERRSHAAMPSSGSPLKLFGDHDTFTNNRLLRRMSQFEETLGNSSDEDEPVSPSEAARRKGENRSFLNARHDSGDYFSRRLERPRSRNTATPQINRFGDGELNHFDFSDTSPYEPKLLNKDIPEQDLRPRSRRRSSVGRRQLRRISYLDSSRDSRLNRRPGSAPHHAPPYHEDANENQESDQNRFFSQSEAKRIPNSPTKDPIPKRRRTLLEPIGSDQEDQEDQENSHLPSQPLSLLQRNLMQHGSRYDDDQRLAQSQSRSARRPRTPTPNQTRSTPVKRPLSQRAHSKTDRIDEESPGDMKIPKVKVTGANEETRKGSITTQDFLNEATKIMNLIRANGKSNGGLSSVEETDNEDDDNAESYEDESTREEFSRPPSREGVDMRKLREPKETNQRVLSHLKKFQEDDDLEFGVNGSAMSLNLEHDEDQGSPEHNAQQDLPGENAGNGPKNQQTYGESFDEQDPTDEEDDDLHGLTQMSSKSFSARSVPTGSSQSSHAKGVLSSDIVSHLIPEQVNGFTYDRFKHLWVREGQKSPEKPKAEESEEDPFQDIPDLSVDELQEMMRTQASGSPEKANNSTMVQDYAASPLSKKESRQPTRDTESVNASTIQSKATRLASSARNSGTRATSWATDEGKETSSEVEHEIQLHEGRLSKPPRPQKDQNHQARVVTISFSSPLVSHVAYSDDSSPTKLARGNRIADSSQKSRPGDEESSQPNKNLAPPRGTPAERKPFIRRPISTIDEQNEDTAEDLSLVRRGDGQIVESTPLKNYPENSLVPGNVHDTSYSFHMSPLPDFTVDQIDQSLQLEVSYIAQRTHPTSLRQVHGTFALATEDLIKHITEAEPFEPYWEHVRRLILREKGLITLHRLSDFCPRLEDLDVAYNHIGQLSGIPSSLRTLKIQHNCLSGLTAWGHLTNLQYLDVSGNDLESLEGFSSLIHLRELKANDNNIRNIDGVFDLNGLLSLKLSNNALTDVDFEGSELTRLTELDLSRNHLTSLQNVSSLISLSTLNISCNQINDLGVSAPLRNLRSLKLSDNRLESFDCKMFPSLTLLYVDQNLLSTVSGLNHCHELEVLSAREQLFLKNSKELFDIDLGLVKDIRKVFLSSNKLSSQILSPSNPLLSLQLLDVASCSFQKLPSDFALSFPNVKVLNLNFNSLTTVEELVGMNCLSRLAVAGNRITRLRRLCQALSRVGKITKGDSCSLQKVDLRGNPLTVRFYPPAVTGNGRDDRKKLKANEERDHQARISQAQDLSDALANLSLCQDDHPVTWEEEDLDKETEINDPYTLPPADPAADQKYLSHLDESTRLRRRVLELMLYAGTRGSVRVLDGLQFRPKLEEGSDMDHAWTKLEKLGVLKKKAITQ